MKRVIVLALVTILLASACVNPSDDSVSGDSLHSSDQLMTDWQQSLNYLKEGNLRFLNNQTMKNHTNEQDRKVLKDGQRPFAVIVTCSDSRVSPEIYFDQKLGNIFVIRNAGNIADITALGSIEYAVEYLKAPLVIVVGHSKCGAVTAAFNQLHEEDGHSHFPANLQAILDIIRPNIKNGSGIDGAIDENIHFAVQQIQENETVKESGAKVLGANYNIETGEVTWIP